VSKSSIKPVAVKLIIGVDVLMFSHGNVALDSLRREKFAFPSIT
jgi:hypothetical protein